MGRDRFSCIGALAVLGCLVLAWDAMAIPPVFKTGELLMDGSKPIMVGRDVVNGVYDGAVGGNTMSAPDLADWNNDGLLDLLVGVPNGRIRLYLNRGTKNKPVFNGFSYLKTLDGRDIASWAGGCICFGGNPECPVPRVVDWDNDGRKDLIIGQWDGSAGLFVYLNQGMDRRPLFDKKFACFERPGAGAGPVYIDPVINYSNPLPFYGTALPFATDLNGDGILDLISGDVPGINPSGWVRYASSSSINYYRGTQRNHGPVTSTYGTGCHNFELFHYEGYNPLASLAKMPSITNACPAGSCKSVVAADWTGGSGRKDLVIGMQDGLVFYAPNAGTASSPAFTNYVQLQAGGTNMVIGSAAKVGFDNTFGGIKAGFRAINDARLAVGDLDGDGLPDLASGCADGTITVFYQSNTNPVALDQHVAVMPDTAKALTLTARVDSGRAVTFSRLSDPAHGGLTGSSSNLVYTPAAGYRGTDSFTFRVSDGVVYSRTATVYLAVNEHAPAVSRWTSPATLSSTAIMSMNTSMVLSLNATDNGDESLTYSIVTPPAHGACSVASNVVTYTPTANYTGPDRFTWKANDGCRDSTETGVDIDVCVKAVNFQPASCAVPAGYLADTGAVYSVDRGYGWSTHCAGSMAVQNANPDPRMDTYVARSNLTTWTCALPANGTYHVTLGHGARVAGVAQQQILSVQGQSVVSNEAVVSGITFSEAGPFAAVVTNNLLTVTIGGGTNVTRLDYVEIRAQGQPVGAATFVGEDDVTQGAWKGKYGTEGYELAIGQLNSYGVMDLETIPLGTRSTTLFNGPDYVICGGALTWFPWPSGSSYAGTTSEQRGLQHPFFDDALRIPTTWNGAFTRDLAFTDGQTHRVAVYGCAWRSATAITQFDIVDAGDGTLLDSRTLSGYANGKWLVWDLRGHVRLRVTGNYACVGGIFFGGPAGMPTISRSPADALVKTGAPATFRVAANGGALRYQWQRSGDTGSTWTNVAGSRADTLTFPVSTNDNAAWFRCLVSNACGAVASDEARLTVSNSAPLRPVITSPLEASVVLGNPFTYKITASNNPVSFDADLPYAPHLTLNIGTGDMVWSDSIGDAAFWNPGLTSAEPMAGTVYFCLKAANAAGEDAKLLTLHINPDTAPVIDSELAVTGAVGVAFTYAITATPGATTFTATGLPDGLVLNPTSGVISGIPALVATGVTRVALGAVNASGTGLAQLYITILGAPAITRQPAALSVVTGLAAQFTIAAVGDAPLCYQWLKNGAVIAGATNALLAMASAQSGDAGSYSVVVSNDFGSVTSSNATLTVVVEPAAPVILVQPAGQSVVAGQTAVFSVTVSGTAPLTYQWSRNGTNLVGATNALLSISATSLADAGGYAVQVANGVGSVASGNAVLAVNDLAWAWWRLDEFGRNTALDSSGCDNTGTVQGVAVWTNGVGWRPDVVQGALCLDGQGNYVSSARSNVNPNVFTLALWFRTTSDMGGRLLGFSRVKTGASSGNIDRCIDMTPSGVLRFSINPGTRQTLATTRPYNDGQWHHVAATLSAGGMALYVDGECLAANTAVTNGLNYTGYWRVGYDFDSYYGADLYFQGLVDDVRIHGRVLSAAEILTLATNSDALAVSDPVQTITFPNPGSQIATGLVTLAATASSGLPVSYEAGGPAVLDGAMMTFSGSGMVSVVASQAGFGAMPAAGNVTNSFAVALAQQAITFPNPGTQGLWSVVTLDATAGSLLPVTYALLPGCPATLTGSSLSFTGTGSVSVAAAQPGNALWAPAPGMTNTFMVTAAGVGPRIVANPASVTASVGMSRTFSVGASGSAPLMYQWRKDGVDIPGATSASYGINPVTLADAGVYLCVVSNNVGAVTSAPATLTVAPVIMGQSPTNVVVVLGSPAGFSVTAAGSSPLAHRWQLNGVTIAGATATNYDIAAVAVTNAGQYRCIVTNTAGAVTGAVATLTVLVPPRITVQPQDTVARMGFPFTFSVAATGTMPIVYQWVRDGACIPGAVTNAYTGTNATSADAGSYWCVLSNVAGVATSAVAALTVTNTPPIASTQTVLAAQDTATPVVLSGYDTDSNALSYAVATLPAHGTLSGTPPNMTYTPSAGYLGGDSFSFTANDGFADSDPAVVTVRVDRALCLWLRFDESSGTNALDTSGYGNNGTLVTSPARVSGKYGNSLRFNGTNQVVVQPGDALNAIGSGNADFSVTFWTYMDVNSDYCVLTHKGDVDQNAIDMWTESGRFVGYQVSTTARLWDGMASSAIPLSLNAWMHVAYVKSNKVMRLYLNGVQSATSTLQGTVLANNGPLYIGLDGWNTGYGFTGRIDDYRIYRRTLDGGEICRVMTNNPASTAITFPNPGPQPMNATVTLAATSSSVLPVGYALVSGPAVLDGALLNFTGTGMVTVLAALPGAFSNLAVAVTNTFAVTKASQTILFNNPGNQVATNVVTLTATALSGLPVSYRVVSGPAVLTGTNLSFNGMGQVVVAADQSGDAVWDPAPGVTNSFTVTYPGMAWGVDASGVWSVGSNWEGNLPPVGAATLACFTNAITASRTVTSDTQPGTIGGLIFAGTGANGWSLAGNPITLSAGAYAPVVAVNAGTATVATALTSAQGLAKTGVGMLILSNANNWGGDVALNAGTLTVAATGALGGAGSLALGTNTTLGFTGASGSVWRVTNAITLAAGTAITNTIANLSSNQTAILTGGITTTDPVAGGTLALGDINGNMIFSNSTVNLGNKQLLFQSGMYRTSRIRFQGSTLTATNITASTTAHYVYLWFDGGTTTITGPITMPGGYGDSYRYLCLTNNASLTVDRFLMTTRSDVRLSGGTFAARQVGVSPKYNGLYLGGTLIRPQADNADFFNHVGSATWSGTPWSYVYVQAGGARFDVSNHTVAIRSPLVGTAGDGGLTKLGAGSLTISGSRTYNGATVVSNGTLAIDFGLQAGSNYNLTATSATRWPTNTASSLLFAGGHLLLNGRANAVATNAPWTIVNVNYAWYATGGDTTGLVAGQGVSVGTSNLFVESVVDGSTFWFSGDPGTNSGVKSLTFSNETFATLQTFTNATLAADATVTVNARGNGTTLRFLNLGGTGTLTKAGSGTLLLAGTNTAFAGAVRIQEGVLVLTNAANLAAGVTNIAVAAGAVLDVSGRTNGTWTLLASQTLSGGGQVVGACVNNGTIVPAGTALIVQGAFTNNGCLTIRPTGPGTAGTLAVSGTAKLGGTLKLDAGAYVPTTGDQFTALTAAGLSGFFAATNLPALADGLGWQVDCQSTAVVLRVTGTVCATNDTYGAWVRNNGNNFGGQTNLFDDPGNRGLPNLARYAFGGSATSGTEVAILEPAVDSTSRWFEVRFQRNYKAKDISYYVEDTAELGGLNGWNCVLSNILGSAWLGSAPCEETGFSNGVSTVDVTCTNVSTPTRFIRVRVTNP
jgi:autotransporter-associated beta strand protein